MMMIERMARAIGVEDERIKAVNQEAAMANDPFACINRREADKLCARAALTALLEPSEGMVASVITEPTHLYDDGSRGVEYQRGMKNAVMIERAVLASRFREMIQAALDEKEGV